VTFGVVHVIGEGAAGPVVVSVGLLAALAVAWTRRLRWQARHDRAAGGRSLPAEG
jgi:hypothetical protein